MADDDELLRELNRKVDSMQRDINDIQGDVNILSTLNKERHRVDLFNLIEGKFGRSDYKRLCWYYADGRRTAGDLAALIDTSKSTIHNYVSEMNREGVLSKEKRNGTVYYDKAEISRDIGLESRVEDQFDDL